MSRSRSTTHWWHRALGDARRLRAVHDHREGPCDLSAQPHPEELHHPRTTRCHWEPSWRTRFVAAEHAADLGEPASRPAPEDVPAHRQRRANHALGHRIARLDPEDIDE